MENKLVIMLEDDHDDRFITEAVLKDLNIKANLTFLSSSDELFNLLHPSLKPAVLLIDYNSRPENAVSVLKKLKADTKLAVIPAVVICDAIGRQYIDECYSAGASAVIKKPASLNDVKETIATFFNYWLKVVE